VGDFRDCKISYDAARKQAQDVQVGLLSLLAQLKQRVDLQRRLLSQLERDGHATANEKDVLLMVEELLGLMVSKAQQVRIIG
jgi:hypothetical protein